PRQLAYMPLWDLRLQVLSAYFCSPREEPRSREIREMHEAEAGRLALTDLLVMREGLVELVALLSAGGRSIVTLPVHFETLARARLRQIYLDFALAIPRNVRQYLAIELCGLPDGVAHGRLLEMINMIRPFCRAVFVRLP